MRGGLNTSQLHYFVRGVLANARRNCVNGVESTSSIGTAAGNSSCAPSALLVRQLRQWAGQQAAAAASAVAVGPATKAQPQPFTQLLRHLQVRLAQTLNS